MNHGRHVLRYLRAIDAKVDRILELQETTNERLSSLETRVTSLGERLDGLQRQLDGIGARLDRIERRLELAEPDK